jgi:CRP/FNR family cyclic AMP-dependent transcriptional regulator
MKELIQVLSEQPFFSGLKESHIETIVRDAREESFAPGAMLLRQGECGGDFFLIRAGKVAIEAHNPGRPDVVVQTLGPGDALGWSWLFPPYVWNFGARAMEPTRVFRLNGARLLVACEQNHDLGYEVAKRVARVMMQRLQATRQQLLDLHEPRV